ncbi:MAG: hypothetical protein ACRDID_23745, partial [Ktedonobacterales bacterium]
MPSDDDAQATQTTSATGVLQRPSARIPPAPLGIGLMIVAGVCGWLMEMTPWGWALVSHAYEGGIGGPDVAALTIFGPTFFQGLDSVMRVSHLGYAARVLIFSAAQFPTVAGVIVGVALIARLRPRVRLALLVIYTLWMLTLLLQLLFFTEHFLRGALATPTGFGALNPAAQVLSLSLGAGYWFAWLAATLGGVGCLLLWRPLLADLRRPWPSTRGRGWVERAGAGVVTLGIVVWIAGFFTLPWVTQSCAGLRFSLLSFSGAACSGLDASDVIIRAPLAESLSIRAWFGLTPEGGMAQALQLLWTTEALYVLLALLAVWALLRVWFGAADARRYGWPVTWLLLAGLVAALAAQGSQHDLRDPLALGSATAPWVYGPGLAVT